MVADLPLLPVTTDLFVSGQNRIRFTRNAEGHVSGALLSTATFVLSDWRGSKLASIRRWLRANEAAAEMK
jgi:hypothetical protein